MSQSLEGKETFHFARVQRASCRMEFLQLPSRASYSCPLQTPRPTYLPGFSSVSRGSDLFGDASKTRLEDMGQP